ncbi:MAG: hypothetical protein RSB41_00395 [Bacilli bacterium]
MKQNNKNNKVLIIVTLLCLFIPFSKLNASPEHITLVFRNGPASSSSFRYLHSNVNIGGKSEIKEVESVKACKDKRGIVETFNYEVGYATCAPDEKKTVGYTCGSPIGVYYRLDAAPCKNAQMTCNKNNIQTNFKADKVISKTTIKTKTPTENPPSVNHTLKSVNCSITSSGRIETREITGYMYKVKGTSDETYCIDPGLDFEANSNYTIDNTFHLPNSTNKEKQFYNGLVTIIQAGKERGYSPDAIETALRLWTGAMSIEGGADGYWNAEDQWSTSTSVFSVTSSLIVKDLYTEYVSNIKTNKDFAPGVMFSLNDTNDAWGKAVWLFYDVYKGRIKQWSPSIKTKSSTYRISDNHKTTITIETNLNNETTIDGITSSDTRFSPEIVKKYQCGNKYCYDVLVSSTNINLKETSSYPVSFEFSYTDTRNPENRINMYNPDKGKKYQKMMLYESVPSKSKISLSVVFTTQEITNPICEGEIKSDISTSCNDKTTSSIIDPSMDNIIDPNCQRNNYVFKSKTSGYFKVYCREESYFNFLDKVDVNSGKYFKYNTKTFLDKKNNINTTSSIKQVRECSVKIDYNGWKNEYDSINKKVLDDYNEYQKYLSLQNANYTTSIGHDSDSSRGCANCCNCHECGTKEKPKTCCSSGKGGKASTSWTSYKWNSTYTYTNPNGSTVTKTAELSSPGSGSVTCDPCSGCRVSSYNGNPNKNANISVPYYNTYKESVNKRDKLLEDMEYYSMYDKNIVSSPSTSITLNKATSLYKYLLDPSTYTDPTLTLEYKDTEYRHPEIASKKEYSEPKTSYCVGCSSTKSLNPTIGTNNINYYNCSNNSCSKTTAEVPNSTLNNINITREVQFYNNDEYYTNILTGGYTTTPGENKLRLENYAYPVHLNTKSGEYEVSLTYKNLNNTKKFIERKKDILFDNITSKFDNTYYCTYNATNKIPFWSEKEVYGIVFRPVDLTNLFPGGREIGENWAKELDIIKYIQKLGNNIWTNSKSTPQYTVILTPKEIQNIKWYNQNKNYLSSETLKCDGATCISTMLKNHDYVFNYNKLNVSTDPYGNSYRFKGGN